jgi:hypothetical protein
VSNKPADSSSQATPTTSAEDTTALEKGDIAEDILSAKLSPSVEVAAAGTELSGGGAGSGAADPGARAEDKRPAGGLLANLDLSLAEIKLSDSPKKKKITKVHLVLFLYTVHEYPDNGLTPRTVNGYLCDTASLNFDFGWRGSVGSIG